MIKGRKRRMIRERKKKVKGGNKGMDEENRKKEGSW